jgi:DNA-binding beta-propeller fold protein YncE
VISRRAVLALPALAAAAACTSRKAGFRGYAFIANQEGHAIAAVDLHALAVAKLIPLEGSPSDVMALRSRPLVYALTPENGSVHEIEASHLRFSRRLSAGAKAVAMHISSDENSLYVLMKEPRAVVRYALDRGAFDWALPVQGEPVDFAISGDGKMAAVTSGGAVRLIDLESRKTSDALCAPAELGAVRFLSDSRSFVVADRGARLISVYDVASRSLIANLPIAVRPDQLCFSNDGGQLFVTGEGVDGVVIVYPYHTPEVGQTVLAGHAPGAMAASDSFLFIASPESGRVVILNIASQKVIAVLNVGDDPGFVAVTPDDQYALVLNRKSGDVAVLRVDLIAPNRYKERAAKLLTVIPVGSRPVSAAVMAI